MSSKKVFQFAKVEYGWTDIPQEVPLNFGHSGLITFHETAEHWAGLCKHRNKPGAVLQELMDCMVSNHTYKGNH